MFEGLCVKEAHPAKPANRVVSKLSSSWVNTTSGRGIKQPGISFGSIFQLIVAGDHTHCRWGKSLASAALNDIPAANLFQVLFFLNLFSSAHLFPSSV